MKEQSEQPLVTEQQEAHPREVSQPRQPFTPPKLTFVKPMLVKRGGADDILAQSLISTSFSP